MISKEAECRYEILVFWQKHGLTATTEAFKVKKRTLQNWKARLKTTIGRLIADTSDKMRIFPQKVGHDGQIRKTNRKKTRKPTGFRALRPGHCISLDTIEFHFWGRRIYVVTMVDVFSRYAFAHVTTSHASRAAEEFFARCLNVFPYTVEFVLTDNGSEFMKDFDSRLRDLCLTHWHTYPRTPKMNAHCERFNRTIQDEFFINHKFLLHNIPYCTTKLHD